MNSLQNIIQAKITTPSSEGPVMDAKTIQFLFEKVVGEFYGAKGKSNVVPLDFKEGTLVLGVYKSLWQAEVSLAREDLLESLNRKIGSNLVHKISMRRK